MIKRKEFYVGSCNECDVEYDGIGEGFTVHNSFQEARSLMADDGWTSRWNKDFCPDCSKELFAELPKE